MKARIPKPTSGHLDRSFFLVSRGRIRTVRNPRSRCGCGGVRVFECVRDLMRRIERSLSSIVGDRRGRSSSSSVIVVDPRHRSSSSSAIVVVYHYRHRRRRRSSSSIIIIDGHHEQSLSSIIVVVIDHCRLRRSSSALVGGARECFRRSPRSSLPRTSKISSRAPPPRPLGF